jgi:adenylate cyclase class 2
MTTPPRHNLERKTPCPDLDAARHALTRLGARCEGLQRQRDTFFPVPNGRLKLREIEGQQAVLIWYDRPDEVGLRTSRYYLVPVPDPGVMRAALSAGLGVRGEVVKAREVWHWHNVRIHLDEVEGLGRFVEFEAVLSDADGEAVSRERLNELGGAMGLREGEDVGGAYADLLGL